MATITIFGTPVDITLSELAIKTFSRRTRKRPRFCTRTGRARDRRPNSNMVFGE